jgi:hypothetical protein
MGNVSEKDKHFIRDKADFQRLSKRVNLTIKQINHVDNELMNLEWQNVLGRLSNKDFLKKYNKKEKTILKSALFFGGNLDRFRELYTYALDDKDYVKSEVIHEKKHANFLKKKRIPFKFGIRLYRDSGLMVQPLVFYPQKSLLNFFPRERIVFNIRLSLAPLDPSKSDKESAKFWKEKLREYDSIKKGDND